MRASYIIKSTPPTHKQKAHQMFSSKKQQELVNPLAKVISVTKLNFLWWNVIRNWLFLSGGRVVLLQFSLCTFTYLFAIHVKIFSIKRISGAENLLTCVYLLIINLNLMFQCSNRIRDNSHAV